MKKSNQKISGFRIPFNKHIQQVINSEFVLTKESIHFIDTLKNLADPMLEGFADECKKNCSNSGGEIHLQCYLPRNELISKEFIVHFSMVIDSGSEFPYIRINENDLEIIKEYFRKCSFYNVSHEKYFHIITKKAGFEIPDNEKIKITVLKNENNEKN